MKTHFPVAALAACTLSVHALAQSSTTVGFDGGSDGGFTGNAFYEAAGGNPGGTAHHLVTAFYLGLRTGGLGEPANPSFLGDYSAFDQVTFAMDVKVDSITDFFGIPIERPIGVALVDRDIQGPNGPSGVFFELGVLSADGQPDWTHLSVTVDDPSSSALPAGWIGFGSEDPNTFEPLLPDGASFATVLAGVDEFHVTGAVPGFFFGNANFDVRIDNVAVRVCEPSQSSYCTSTGATISSTGSLAWSDNSFGLSAAGVPDTTGLFFMGSGQRSMPFGNGTLCVEAPLKRLSRPARASGNSALLQLDLLDGTSNAGLIAPCSTWNFQYVYRVPQSFDLTDGLSVTFGS